MSVSRTLTRPDIQTIPIPQEILEEIETFEDEGETPSVRRDRRGGVQAVPAPTWHLWPTAARRANGQDKNPVWRPHRQSNAPNC